MLRGINKLINELRTLGYNDFRIKINSNTDNKLFSETNIGVQDGKKYGYTVKYQGIPIIIDDNVKDNNCVIEININEFCDINKILNKYKIQKEVTMEYKIWTLEEAQEDYKRTQIKKCCKNCKFYKEDVSQGWLGEFVDLCLVKEKEIYYDAKNIGQDCKYFNYID